MRHHIADPVVHREHWREPEDDQLRLECGVCGVWGAPENEASSIVALGRTLNLKVVAEGVETQAQCQFLIKAGCTLVQGFYFAKPLSAAELEQRWLPPPLAEGAN